MKMPNTRLAVDPDQNDEGFRQNEHVGCATVPQTWPQDPVYIANLK
jgi:hypothetical protein